MKIRNGFVSNSSSSSYIIRGVVITEDEANKIAKQAGKNPEDFDDSSEMLDEVIPWDGVVTAMTRHNYFDCDEENGFIVGKNMGDLADGSFVEMPEADEKLDTEIIQELAKYGIEADKLKTYVKMISNDNY